MSRLSEISPQPLNLAEIQQEQAGVRQAVPRAPVPVVPGAPGRGDASQRNTAQSPFDQADRKIISALVKQVNERLSSAETATRRAFLVYDEEGDDQVIEIRSGEDDEVIAQIPPDAIIHMREQLREIVGMIFDRRL
jgi:uncharacterized FlaG/YvyC family protein